MFPFLVPKDSLSQVPVAAFFIYDVLSMKRMEIPSVRGLIDVIKSEIALGLYGNEAASLLGAVSVVTVKILQEYNGLHTVQQLN